MAKALPATSWSRPRRKPNRSSSAWPGEDFAVLAKKHSICPSGKRGGDLGEVRPGQMVRVIDQVIFKKPVRTIHGPVKSQFGYHLVQVFFRD